MLSSALFFGWSYVPSIDNLIEAIEWMRTAGPIGHAAFIVGYGLFTVMMLPASWSHGAAGFLYGPWLGPVVASTCATAFSAVNFWLGRTLLRGWVEKKVANSPRLAALDRVIGDGGAWVVVLIRLPPLSPFNPMSAVLGASKVRFRDFLLGTWIGGLLPVLFFSYLGATASDLAALFSGESAGPGWMQTLPILVTLAVCIPASRFAQRTLNAVMDAPTAAPAR